MRIPVLLAVSFIVSVTAFSQEGRTSLKSFSWLAGTWEGRSDGATFEEHWTTPVGGMMIGMGRQTKGDETLFTEFIRLAETKDGIFYSVTVGDQDEVSFKLASSSSNEFVFENDEHDFPSKISYKREKDGSLTASIHGTMDGKPVSEQFKLAKKK